MASNNNQSFPDAIIFEILKLLPLKTICKFRCVSKSWFALIADPIFCRSYSLRPVESCRRRRRVLITTIESCPHHYSIDPRGVVTEIPKFKRPIDGEFLSSVLTCLDLVCLYDTKHVYIWDPTMGHVLKLPPFYFVEKVVGFARVVSADAEYKLLCLTSSRNYGVFTFRGDPKWCSWKECKPPPFPVSSWNSATVNSVVHLIPQLGKVSDLGIARYDLEKEKWSVLMAPAGIQEIVLDWWTITLREVSGVLCLINYDRFGNQMMWLFKDEVWIEYAMDFSSLFGPGKPRSFCNRPPVAPLAIEEDGRVLLEDNTDSYKPKLHYYDPERKLFQTIYQGSTACFEIRLYNECLVPAKTVKVGAADKNYSSLSID